MAAKPWEISPEVAAIHAAKFEDGRGAEEYTEVVDSDYGEHERTRPGPGYTEPGGGRPTGNSVDNSGVDYRRHNTDETFGIRDEEELYTPGPAQLPKPGKGPVQPHEWEAVWEQRALRRAGSKPGGTLPQTKIVNTEEFMQPHQPRQTQPPSTTSPDPVVADLERQIADRMERLEAERRMKHDLGNYEVRIVVTEGEPTYLIIEKAGNVKVIKRGEVLRILSTLS